MPYVCFVRHADSEDNAKNPDLLELTPKGVEEAKAVSRTFLMSPSLILTSPYIRTRQTAQPTIDFFNKAVCEEWEIYEFTYLSPLKYRRSTFHERLPFANAYWLKGDVFYKDGDDAESFTEFVRRCQRVLGRLQKSKETDILAFSHQEFMLGIKWLVECRLSNLNETTMMDFRQEMVNHPIDHCGKLEFDL